MAGAFATLDFVALDTETTGLGWGDRVVELGAVRFRGDEVLGTFQTLVHPQRAIPERVTRIHGITDAMVARAPTAPDVLPALARFCAGAVLLAHFASFDQCLLATEYARAGTPAPTAPLYCTLTLARALVPGAPSYGLGPLLTHLGIPSAGSHRALADAHNARSLFLRCCGLMTPRNLAKLQCLAGPALSLRMDLRVRVPRARPQCSWVPCANACAGTDTAAVTSSVRPGAGGAIPSGPSLPP